MKYTKAAAVVVGAVMAVGAASPAFAAPKADGGSHQLLDSDTKTKQDLKNPLGDLDVKAWLGSLDKVADKLKTKNDTKAATAIGNTGKNW